MCVILKKEWRELQFKVHSKRQIFENPFQGNFHLHSCSAVAEEILSHISFDWRCLTCVLNRGLIINIIVESSYKVGSKFKWGSWEHFQKALKFYVQTHIFIESIFVYFGAIFKVFRHIIQLVVAIINQHTCYWSNATCNFSVS